METSEPIPTDSANPVSTNPVLQDLLNIIRSSDLPSSLNLLRQIALGKESLSSPSVNSIGHSDIRIPKRPREQRCEYGGGRITERKPEGGVLHVRLERDNSEINYSSTSPPEQLSTSTSTYSSISSSCIWHDSKHPPYKYPPSRRYQSEERRSTDYFCRSEPESPQSLAIPESTRRVYLKSDGRRVIGPVEKHPERFARKGDSLGRPNVGHPEYEVRVRKKKTQKRRSINSFPCQVSGSQML